MEGTFSKERLSGLYFVVGYVASPFTVRKTWPFAEMTKIKKIYENDYCHMGRFEVMNY